jgi:hypothetical protein
MGQGYGKQRLGQSITAAGISTSGVHHASLHHAVSCSQSSLHTSAFRWLSSAAAPETQSIYRQAGVLHMLISANKENDDAALGSGWYYRR